jgi:hypothetical protein
MSRFIAALVAVLVALFFVPAVASATDVPPPSGTISCTVNGTFTIKPPLTNTPSTKAVEIKGAAASTACDNSGVSGGKAPIASVAIKSSAALPVGTTCTTLVSSPSFVKSKLQYKWQSFNPTGRPRTVGVDNTRIASLTFTNIDPASYDVTSQMLTQTRQPFFNSTVTLHVALDGEYSDVAADCGGEGVSTLTFGNEYVASVSVP